MTPSVICLRAQPHLSIRLALLETELPLLVLGSSADFSSALGYVTIYILQLLPSRPLALISFGKRRSEPIWETLPAEEADILSRSARLCLAGYICSFTHLSQPQSRLPPLSPLSRVSCTIGASLRPCSPCSGCAIVVWATGYFLLGAKDYSVIRNVCLSGRLRNKDYK